MNHTEVLKMFESDSDILTLLEKLNPMFEKINSYRNMFQNHNITSDTSTKTVLEAIEVLTGIYMYLNPIYSIALSIKQNKEDIYYVQRKSEIVKGLDGKKFVSAPLDREASAHVATYRTIRNLLESYVQSCNQAILSCQSILKYMGEEMRLHK